MQEINLKGYPASWQQKRLWKRLTKAAGEHNSLVVIEFNGALPNSLLRKAAGILVARHEIFRVRLACPPGARLPRQVVASEDLYQYSETEVAGDAEAEARISQEQHRPFDPDNGEVIRFTRLQISPVRSLLCITTPGLYADAATLSNLYADLADVCAAIAAGKKKVVNRKLQYIDYSEWQRERDGAETRLARQYWEKFRREAYPILPFQLEARPDRFRVATIPLALDASVYPALAERARGARVEVSDILLACWYLTLQRYLDVELVVGYNHPGRADRKLRFVSGPLEKTLPLCLPGATGKTLPRVWQAVRRARKENHRYQDDYLPEATGENGTTQYIPYGFYDRETPAPREKSGIGYRVYRETSLTDPFVLRLLCTRCPGAATLEIALQYEEGRFERDTLENFLTGFRTLLEHALAGTPGTAANLPAGPAEMQRVVHGFNAVPRRAPAAPTLVALFERQALATPEGIAVVHGDATLTYRQLNGLANRIAHVLQRERGLGTADLVAVQLGRSQTLIAVLLGILKAGAAFLPIDPSTPAERTKFILKDSGAKLLFAETGGEATRPAGVAVVEAGAFLGQARREGIPETNPAAASGPEDPVYVIYTSGTTGTPKGVVIPHGALASYVTWFTATYGVGPSDRTLLFSSVAFDLTYTSLWSALAAGSALHVLPDSKHLDPQALTETLIAQKITFVKLTPSHFSIISRNPPDAAAGYALRLIVLGGENIRVQEVESYLSRHPGVTFVNHYGPTETTIGTVAYTLPGDALTGYQRNPVIGRPIANNWVYVLGADYAPLPIGAVGQIAVAGAGLASGYLNRPALTAEKFVGAVPPGAPTARMYLTGDLGKWMPDGTLRFLGRNDDQVKIRGHRVEPGEVERWVAAYEQVKEAVVVVRGDGTGDPSLVAYCVAAGELDVEGLKGHLRTCLPEYMLPAHFVQLAQLPLLAHGKVNKKALPAPQTAPDGPDQYAPPRTRVEKRLAEIWQSVLGRERVGIRDNFFAAGGHSLKAMQVMSRIYRELDAKIDIGSLFDHPTIEELAGVIARARRTQYEPIARVAEKEYYEVSNAQKRLWIMDQVNQGDQAYLMPNAYRIGGRLNGAALEETLGAMARRHESLRTTFTTRNGEPVQRIAPAAGFRFACETLDLRNDPDAPAQLPAIVRERGTRPFDLETGPLWRVCLIRTGEEEHVLVLVMHHIISDGWSQDVFLKETLALYRAFSAGAPDPLLPLTVQYKDFAAWQRGQLSGDSAAGHQAYWLQQFREKVPALELPADRPRPPVRTSRGGSRTLDLDAGLSDALRALGSRQGASLYMTLVAAVAALLHRYTGQDRMVIGAPVAGREHPDLEDQIGFYLNNLPFRIDFEAGDAFETLLGRVKTTVLEAYQHQLYPFDQLVEDLRLPRDPSRSPLFDVVVLLQNQEADAGAGEAGLVIEEYGEDFNISTVDLRIVFKERPAGIQVCVNYNRDLFDASRIGRLLGHFREMIASATGDSRAPLHRLNYLTPGEKHQLLRTFNDTAVPYPPGRTMVDLFEESVLRTPHADAVVWAGGSCTYAQLNGEANKLAHYLRQCHGVGAGDVVGVMLEPSERMLVAVLGVWKAGAAYLPLDPAHPAERRAFMLGDARATVLLTDAEFMFSLGPYEGAVVALDLQLPGLEADPGTRPRTGQPGDLAYVLYTSGSTGQPKGVMIEQGGVVNLVRAQVGCFGITAHDKVLQFAALTFDASVSEIGTALAAGAALVLPRRDLARDPGALLAYLAEKEVSVATLPPALLNTLEPQSLPLRVLISAGEAANPVVARQLSRHCTYFNAYGPTECSVCLTIQPVADLPESRLRVPIGRPLANTRLYLLDRNRELVPVGVPGQIYAAGPGLARGYVNQEALTAQKFVPNPFEPGGRLYASGDLGQWLEDGTVDFIGRADFQEKIRGYRIEPAEVEHALLAHPDVRNALVMGRTDSQGSRQLVAYVESGPTVDTGSLRRFLQQRLPEYMIPAWLVPVAAMPLTGSGKIDRDQLPLPETAPEAAGAYREARNEIEEKLVRIWESVLGKPKVGVKDNFFLSGGDSIKAIQVASRLNGSGYRLDIRDLFETPVLEDLAPRVVPVRRVADQSPVTGAVPLTPIQRHFFATVATAPWHYNQSVMLTAPAGFDPEAVRAVFTKIQEHHDALRMTFQGAGAAVVQENASLALPLSLAVFEADAPEADPGVLDRLQESFSLAQGPLMKLALFRHPAGDQLLIVIHHLVVDGVSWRVLLEDIGQLFGQYREGQPLCLPPKTDSFRAWAHALASYADSLAFGAEKAYWEAMEQGDSAPLPVDFVIGTNQVQDARRVSAVLPVADTGLLLTTVHEAYNTTINDLLLAALGTCLQEAFGVTRAVVFLEGHGREESIGELDVSRTVGWFTSWYPVALTGGDGSDWSRQIKQTKETLRRVPNKGIGYGLFRYLSGSRPVAATLPPRLVFNYLGQFDADFSGHPFGVSGAGTGHEKPAGQERGSGLVVTGMVTGGQLSLSIEYNVGQYREETIRGLLYRYREALEGVIRHCTEQTERELTPSDLTYKDLSLEALQSISSMFN